MDQDAVKNFEKNLNYLKDAPKKIFWPSDTGVFDRLVKVTDDDRNDFISVELGNKQYISDILLNVETKNADEVISFNINDFFPGESKASDFTILGNILLIDNDNNHGILDEKNYIKIIDHIFYMPKDIYLTIDLHTGNVVFKNAPSTSELHVKYISFFLMRQEDYDEIEKENEKKPLTEDQKHEINKTIDNYDILTDEQRKEINALLETLVYNNEKAKVEEFVLDCTTDNKKEQRIVIPLKEDGTVDINTFTDQVSVRYTKQTVDLSTIEFDKTTLYLPVMNKKDITNLGLIGFAPQETENIITTMRNTLTNAFKEMEEISNNIEALEENYAKSYSTCSSLITNNVYNSTEYDQTMKNNYTPLGMMKEYRNEYERISELFINTQQTLASFQSIARVNVQKAIDDGEFTNRHTFSSLVVFFKTMLANACIEGKDESNNYGVYNAYLKYINRKTNELQHDYFINLLINTFNPGKEPNIYTLSKEVLNRFVRINDLQDYSKPEIMKRIMERIENRIHYLFEVSLYPFKLIQKNVYELKTLLFNTQDNREYVENFEKQVEQFHQKGWPSVDFSICTRSSLIEKAHIFRDKLMNKSVFECIIGFLKMMRLTVLSEYHAKIIAKRNKTNIDMFYTAVNFTLLGNIIIGIDDIINKTTSVIDENKEEKEISLSDEEVCRLLGSILYNLACYIVFVGTSLRLSNAIAETALNVEKINEYDAQTFFSVIINGLIIPIEILESAEDKGRENDTYLDTIIPQERLKLLGEESSKIFFNGLKGIYKRPENDEQKDLFEPYSFAVSRLFNGRAELLEEAITFSEHIYDILNAFIDQIVPPDVLDEDTNTIPDPKVEANGEDTAGDDMASGSD